MTANHDGCNAAEVAASVLPGNEDERSDINQILLKQLTDRSLRPWWRKPSPWW
jgi:hypothetical protein